MLQKNYNKINKSYSKISLVKRNLVIKIINTQQAFTSPISAAQTPEQGTNNEQTQQ